jgi:nucleoside-diphosphate-sugar epimerase
MVADSRRGRVLVTGANGFVGRSLCNRLRSDGWEVVAAVRTPLSGAEVRLELTDSNVSYVGTLQRVSHVIHLAARVHVKQEDTEVPVEAFRTVNCHGTLDFAEQAASAGVKRFVFLSTVKVLGEMSVPGSAFSVQDKANPQDGYAVSKWEAEQGLLALSKKSSMDVVIVRCPLVYGLGVKANFASMMEWLHRGWPIPFGAVTENRRSLVSLDNLNDLLVTCLDHPEAVNQTFLVSDGEDLSIADLLKRMGAALGIPARLFCVPTPILKWGGHVLGKEHLYQRLCESLQLDIRKTCETLNWAPPQSVEDGLLQAARGFLEAKSGRQA